MKTKSTIAIVFLIVTNTLLFGNESPVLKQRKWTSNDGRTIEATLIRVEQNRVTLKPAKGTNSHSFEIEKLSKEDQDLITDNQLQAQKLVTSHNKKVERVSWKPYWYYSQEFSIVPELAADELRLIYAFGVERDLEIFAVKFTPNRIKVAPDKLTTTMIGSEGFAVKAKADSNWVFMESGQKLNVRPKIIDKGSTQKTITAYTIGVGERFLFPNGRSISETTVGISSYLTLSLDNSEPRIQR